MTLHVVLSLLAIPVPGSVAIVDDEPSALLLIPVAVINAIVAAGVELGCQHGPQSSFPIATH
jgi:hypothetical protein